MWNQCQEVAKQWPLLVDLGSLLRRLVGLLDTPLPWHATIFCLWTQLSKARKGQGIPYYLPIPCRQFFAGTRIDPYCIMDEDPYLFNSKHHYILWHRPDHNSATHMFKLTSGEAIKNIEIMGDERWIIALHRWIIWNVALWVCSDELGFLEVKECSPK